MLTGNSRYCVCLICYNGPRGGRTVCLEESKQEGIIMYQQIFKAVESVDNFVWGWGMICLLLGTHLFLTIRTGFIQRKTITKGIPLSVSKEEGADGEVSQFGALATALASTIGTGNIIGVGTAIALGSRTLVLADGRIRHSDQVCGVADCRKIPGENTGRTHAGRRHVRA